MKTLNERLILRMSPKLLRDFGRYWYKNTSRMDPDRLPYKLVYILKESCNVGGP
jgi:hypothetical protein